MNADIEQTIQEIRLAIIEAKSPWANRQQAAAYCGCSVRKIDEAAEQGKIKRYKNSGVPVYKKDDLDKWLEGDGPVLSTKPHINFKEAA